MRLAGAGPGIVSAMFALYGIVGLCGNVIASAVVTPLGMRETSVLFMISTLHRHGAVGVRRRLAAGDRRRHLVLGTRLCRHQLDAAGATGGGGARSAERDDRAQHLDRSTPARRSAPASAAFCSASAYLHAIGYIGVAFVASALALVAATWERQPARCGQRVLTPRDQRLDLRQHAFDHDGVALRVVMRVVAGAVLARRQVPLRRRRRSRRGRRRRASGCRSRSPAPRSCGRAARG